MRGLDYYNRTVFEWVTDELGAQGTVGGGGRYDGLIEQLGGKPTPACGFAHGHRARDPAAGRRPGARTTAAPDVYVVHVGEPAGQALARIAESLRDAGLAIVVNARRRQLQIADEDAPTRAVLATRSSSATTRSRQIASA